MVDKGDILNALRAVASDDQPLHLPLAIGDHLDRRLVRPAHVREAFADRDAAVLLRHEDAELALMTKAVGGIARPFVWLVVLARAMDQWQVSHALRLYGDDNARAAWQADPVEAFADALDRWDIDFTSGAQPVRFMPYRRITASPQNFGTVISALGDRKSVV